MSMVVVYYASDIIEYGRRTQSYLMQHSTLNKTPKQYREIAPHIQNYLHASRSSATGYFSLTGISAERASSLVWCRLTARPTCRSSSANFLILGLFM